MKVFTATFGTETDTDSPIPTGLGAFRDTMLWRPGEHPDLPTEATGALWDCRRPARELGWRVVEGTCAYAMPGGTVAQPAYEFLRDEILGQLQAALPVDVVALGLHGAMVSDRTTDCEGDLLARVRALVGTDVAVGAELDCHAHLTQSMLDAADVLVFFKEYPHTDFVERGEELLDLLEATRRKTIRPVMRAFHCRMIAALPTREEPMRGFLDNVRTREVGPILSISIVHGFPRGDVPEMGTQVLVVSNDDAELAASLAHELGLKLFDLRAAFRSTRVPITEALATARAVTVAPIMLVDADDNPGGGAPGDNTEVLRHLLDQGMTDACFGPLWDPVVVRFCFDAGVGAKLTLRLGGKTGIASGVPFDTVAEVTALTRDHAQRIDGVEAPLGDAAALLVGGIAVVVVSIRDPAYAPGLFEGVGIECRARRYIAVKSQQQFHLGFDAVTDRVVMLRRSASTREPVHVTRPLWPLDPDFILS